MSKIENVNKVLSKHYESFVPDAKNMDISIFMQHIAHGLSNPDAQIPKILTQHLGDRSKYIGASAATGCLRKSSLDVKDLEKKHSAKQMFVFER